MKKALDPFLPILGVAGLIALWYFAVWKRIVDPVLLPSPGDTFQAMYKGLAGGRLSFDFIKTVGNTAEEMKTTVDGIFKLDAGILAKLKTILF